jgi:uncharacterized protein YlxW (UPF0749 family)
VILDSYTVYLDLWIVDATGTVVANGRPNTYPVSGKNVADATWFRDAMKTPSGSHFVVGDVETLPLLKNAHVATYATAIREQGAVDGRPLGDHTVDVRAENPARAHVRSGCVER